MQQGLEVPSDFIDAVIDTFLLERAALRAKKMPQGYLQIEDILDEPMMAKVVERYGKPQSRRFVFEMAVTPRKNPKKLLEYDHASFLNHASSTTRNTSQLRVRPIAHKFRELNQQMKNQWEYSKAEFEAEQAAQYRGHAFNPNAEEYVPPSVLAKQKENEENAMVNAMFKRPPTVENIRPIWNRNKTARKRKGRKARKNRKSRRN